VIHSRVLEAIKELTNTTGKTIEIEDSI